ncbi:MAG: hypothetical protein EOO88_42635 [Pedobacter sp.]|nr:MAG: hypothetical protein EOO88_42635 [Pedobacter sp.]
MVVFGLIIGLTTVGLVLKLLHMGYELHITRQDLWVDKDPSRMISSEEWLEYIASDPEMSLDGFAEVQLSENKVLRVEDPSLAVWRTYSRAVFKENQAWFYLYEGNIEVKNPDKEIIVKMAAIGSILSAKVQGDEGEIYNHFGVASDTESNEKIKADLHPSLRPWWKFW